MARAPFPFESIINDAAESTASINDPDTLPLSDKPFAIAEIFLLCDSPLTWAKYAVLFISMLTCQPKKSTILFPVAVKRCTGRQRNHLRGILCTRLIDGSDSMMHRYRTKYRHFDCCLNRSQFDFDPHNRQFFVWFRKTISPCVHRCRHLAGHCMR